MSGPVESSTRPGFDSLLMALCGQATGDVHLDLGELDGIDVTGVVVLLRGAATLRPPGKLVLHNPPTALGNVLELLGLDPESAGMRLV